MIFPNHHLKISQALTIALSSLASCLLVHGQSDLLRFANNDQLHGKYQSIDSQGQVVWKNDHAEQAIAFKQDKLHRIIFNNAQPAESSQYTQFVELSNGDILPAKVESLDANFIQLDTDYAGHLSIPRNKLKSIYSHPYQGRLLYYGPLNEDGWVQVSSPEENGDEEFDDEELPAEDPTDWTHHGLSWYSTSDSNQHLVRENALTDQCSLRFEVEWRDLFYLNVALFAETPNLHLADEDAAASAKKKLSTMQKIGEVTGQCYVLTLSQHNANLLRLIEDEKGEITSQKISDRSSSVRAMANKKMAVEIRISRPNRLLLLFIDGQLIKQWPLGSEVHTKGLSLALSNGNNNHTRSNIFKISQLSISEWSGYFDSPASMEVSDQDLIMLHNGIDRMAGNCESINNGKVTFYGPYDSQLSVPLDEVKVINFATENISQESENDNQVSRIFLAPYGRISGSLVKSDHQHLNIKHSLIGNVPISIHFASTLDFSANQSLLDLWDDRF
ncbi:hypothetical protein [Persicirhabdus sediminis]|uniref:Uncharacterized protein n=1 Tax=Persicirhabdus sediminis TaxID=454144 RepID=A0A8J7MBJ4_9BACT|nr:hypothetical protein [Persicirhabdus sediminis]MBK1790412.1 hypothetical protein [Persicirhabdus sediminis]